MKITATSKGQLGSEMCTECFEKVSDALPDISIDSIVRDMRSQKGFRAEMEAAFVPEEGAEEDEDDLPCLEVIDWMKCFCEVDQEYDMPTRQQIIDRFRRTPKALKLRPFRIMTGKFGQRVVYPIRRKKKSTLRMVQRFGTSCKKHVIKKEKEHFQSQVARVARQAHEDSLKGRLRADWSRVPSDRELKQRARSPGAVLEDAREGNDGEGERAIAPSDNSDKSVWGLG